MQNPDFSCRNYIYLRREEDVIEKLVCPAEIYKKTVNIVKERTKERKVMSKKEDLMKKIVERLSAIEDKINAIE